MTADIFLHVPKAAGLTLRRVLRANYEADTVYDDHPDEATERRRRLQPLSQGPGPAVVDREVEPNIDVIERLAELDEAERARLRLLMGHFWYGIHEHVPATPRYFTFLRHPVERVLSLYGHRVDQQDADVGIERFIAADPAANNEQTRRIAGRIAGRDIRRVPCDDAMLDRAIANMDAFGGVGIVERFDESLVVLARTFQWCDVSYTSVNVNRSRPTRDRVAAEVVRAIEDANRYDIELYRHARAALEQQIAASPDIGAAAAALRQHDRGPMSRIRYARARLEGGNVTKRIVRRARRAFRRRP